MKISDLRVERIFELSLASTKAMSGKGLVMAVIDQPVASPWQRSNTNTEVRSRTVDGDVTVNRHVAHHGRQRIRAVGRQLAVEDRPVQHDPLRRVQERAVQDHRRLPRGAPAFEEPLARRQHQGHAQLRVAQLDASRRCRWPASKNAILHSR